MQRLDLLIIKLNKTKNKNHPEGEKQADRQKTGAQSNVKYSHNIRQRISTGLQTQGELYRETNEGNEGDTAGATETMIK